MTRPVKAIHKSLSLLKEDKVILLLSFIPVLIGIIAYYYIGNLFYVDLLDWGKNLVAEKVGNSEWLSYVAWIFTAILTVILYFLVSWTFVLFVSIISSPFNDIISGRVEKRLLGEVSPDFNTEKFFKRILTVLVNESKKISFILVLSVLSFILGLFFPPIAFCVSALLLAISFLDYSWSRKELSFSECINSLRKSFLTYLLTGCVFMGLISMPILNLFILPFAVIYYSVLFYSKENELKI
ncbi:EI24 domain-containing protein [Halobacteriovorax sp.]|uniref:EI24 domain-containing protein n=1 Tax=Halobacteriovorax sp. TaxID=2020862 RepID=UPI0035678510